MLTTPFTAPQSETLPRQTTDEAPVRPEQVGLIARARTAITSLFGKKRAMDTAKNGLPDILMQYAAEADLAYELPKQGAPLQSMQALILLEAISDELASPQTKDRRIALMNASNCFGQYASIMASEEIDDPRSHGRLATFFDNAAAAVRVANTANAPSVTTLDEIQIDPAVQHFEKVADLHVRRALRHLMFAAMSS